MSNNHTAEEIERYLEGYTQLTTSDLATTPLDTHLRYFTNEDGQQKFRLGGFLKNNEHSDKYIMLTNGTSTWSVQVASAVFFRKLAHHEEVDELHNMYQKIIKEKDTIIHKLQTAENLQLESN